MEGRYNFHSILDHIIIIDENIFKIEGYRERERKEGEKDGKGLSMEEGIISGKFYKSFQN